MTVNQISVFWRIEPAAGGLYQGFAGKRIDMRASPCGNAGFWDSAHYRKRYLPGGLRAEGSGVYFLHHAGAGSGDADESGSLYEIVRLLGDNGINLEYYVCVPDPKKGRAYMIFRVEDNDKASDVLERAGMHIVSQEELEEL